VKLAEAPWDGSNLNGRRILLHAEQGLGDVLQFIRYVPSVAARGGKVILHCHGDLHRLLQGNPGIAGGIVEWTTPEHPLPSFDAHCPMLSLPRVFRTGLATIPADGPYLKADEQLRQAWQGRVAALPGKKAGLVWAGRAAHGNDRHRSMTLKHMAPLFGVAGISFVSLQKLSPSPGTPGEGRGEGLASSARTSANPHPNPLPAYQERGPEAAGAGLRLTDWTAELHDFADTAALVANLDLVITIDSAVAHLAGAMGKPVWLLLPLTPDWRWMLGRSDSPWYPSMRLFRQSVRGDWSHPINQILEALPSL
jgi:hypothetical protein